MLYLVNWSKNGHMQKGGSEIVDAKSVYDAKAKFLRVHWNKEHRTMALAIQLVKAKCLEDKRFAFPLSERSFKDPYHAYNELLLTGAKF